MNHDENIDYSQPVAYDTNGRPLYAHPPKDSVHQKSHEYALKQAVHIARAAEPMKQKLSDSTIRRHKESVKRFPKLNLTDGEFVISVVKRHPIGVYIPVGFAALLILLIVVGLVNYPTLVPSGRPSLVSFVMPSLSLAGLISLGAYVVAYVYYKNRFILTNESVIQETQQTLFAHREQTVSLVNIEDVSYTQHGILQMLFNYGSIRLSTEGEETTYRFQYVENPKKQVATLHNAVEAFKNGRPIG